MNDNGIDLRPDARSAGGEVLRYRGRVEKNELRAALKAAGVLRRTRLIAAVGTLAIALLGVRITADGASVRFVYVAAAAVYGTVFCLLMPRRIVSRAFKSAQAHGERECAVDDDGITVFCAEGEQARMSWDQLQRFHETPDIYALVGRTGRKTCFFVLPKRLMTAPGQDELVGALLDSRLRRA